MMSLDEGMNQQRRLILVQTLIGLLLALLFLGVWVSAHIPAQVPLHTGKYDPALVYLISSLGIFKSQPYAYIDHPGTPVELVGTIILALMRPFTRLGSESYWISVLQDPGSFFMIADGLLTVFGMVTGFLLVRFAIIVRRWIDLLFAAVVGAVFFVSMPLTSFNTLVTWSHNSFTFTFGTLSWLIVWLRLRKRTTLAGWELVVLGLSMGVLTAVQLYFVAWPIGVMLAIVLYTWVHERNPGRTLRVVCLFCVSVPIGFFIATLPIIHKYRELAWWVRRLLLHEGRYGSGPEGVISGGLLGSSLSQILDQSLIFAVILLIGLVLLGAAAVFQKRTSHRGPDWCAPAVGISIQIVLAAFAVLRHPGGIYLLSIAALLPLVYALAFDILRDQKAWAAYLSTGISIAIVLGFSVTYVQALQGFDSMRMTIAADTQLVLDEKERLASGLDAPADELTTLWGYGTFSHCYALRFGDFYSEGIFSEEITGLCPHDWMYDVWSHQAALPGGIVDLADSQAWDLLVLRARDVTDVERHAGEVVNLPSGSQVLIIRSGTD
jgi:hypothetical protein